MGKLWTDDEYDVTDATYQAAIEKRRQGLRVSPQEIVETCRRQLSKRNPSSIRPQLQNLTAARGELGLPTLPELTPFKNRPPKLIKFLKAKYRLP